MTILNRSVFPNNRPYVDFCVVGAPFDETWSSAYKQGVFCEIPEDLVGTYCSLTRSYLPFDMHAFTQLTTPDDIYSMTSNLLLWEFQLARTPDNYFSQEAHFWAASHQFLDSKPYSAAEFKADLIETLHFLIGNMNQVAANKKCVIIAGI
jgi:hypothetical protein